MKTKKIILSVFKVIVCSIFLSIFVFSSGAKSDDEPRGLFSWKDTVFEDDGAELFSFMNKNGFNELYQWSIDDLEDVEIVNFLRRAKRANIDVYMLAGDPSWANDSGGRRQLRVVTEVARINKLNEKYSIKGIVFDIEPYLLDSWDNKMETLMERFLLGMRKAYKEAASNDIEIVLCIPFYYDNMGVKGYMEKLIESGCDRIAIMNYSKKSEADNIEREVRYAQKYEKGIINIYEFKAPGTHGLRDVNTYHSDGFEAAVKSFDSLKKKYPDSGVSMAAHDYEALKRVIK